MDLDYINTQQETEWKWYIIRQENTLPQLWNFLINSLTVYAMFATPFVLVFPAASDNIVVLDAPRYQIPAENIRPGFQSLHTGGGSQERSR